MGSLASIDRFLHVSHRPSGLSRGARIVVLSLESVNRGIAIWYFYKILPTRMKKDRVVFLADRNQLIKNRVEAGSEREFRPDGDGSMKWRLRA
jgi:hypothetical protein